MALYTCVRKASRSCCDADSMSCSVCIITKSFAARHRKLTHNYPEVIEAELQMATQESTVTKGEKSTAFGDQKAVHNYQQ